VRRGGVAGSGQADAAQRWRCVAIDATLLLILRFDYYYLHYYFDIDIIIDILLLILSPDVFIFAISQLSAGCSAAMPLPPRRHLRRQLA